MRQPLPNEMYIPGLIAGGGIDLSRDRLSLPINALSQANNVEPTAAGFSNESLGVRKLNTNSIGNSKVQHIAKFNNRYCLVIGGDFCTMPLIGGVITLVQAGAFNSTAKVRSTIALGSGDSKLFLCDGVSEPKTWDGTSLQDIAAFANPILVEILPSNKPDKVVNYKSRVAWGFPAGGVNEAYILASNIEDGDSYTSGAGADNAWFEILQTQGKEIKALATLKRSGDNIENEIIGAFTEDGFFSENPSGSPADNRFGVFTNHSSNIGAVNQECAINFYNSIYTLSSRGIGSLDSALNEVTASLLQGAARVNPLITGQGSNANGGSSSNSAFANSFILSSPGRDFLWVFTPENRVTSTSYEGFEYPETPMNLTIGYKYGVRDESGQGQEVWYTRKGQGWAWSTGISDGDKVILGSYFGDIYQCFESSEYERNPLDPDTPVPIQSVIETGDMAFGSGITQTKRISDLFFYWETLAGTNSTVSIVYNQQELGEPYDVSTGGVGDALVWDVGRWGVNIWAGLSKSNVRLFPYNNYAYSVRIKVEWDSRAETGEGFRANFGSLYGISGNIIYGGAPLGF